jgi:hypothetical protein
MIRIEPTPSIVELAFNPDQRFEAVADVFAHGAFSPFGIASDDQGQHGAMICIGDVETRIIVKAFK